jgi:N-sulfoglucosamine sulfohydrolase
MLLVVLMITNVAVARSSEAADRPNLLLILADDLTWRDVGFVGNTEVQTPNLDQLASQSMHLRHMFVSAPMCTPVRSALYTGLFGVRSGAYPNHSHTHSSTRSIFTHLKAHGYRAGLQIKQHVGPRQTFDYEYLGGGHFDFEGTRAFITRDPQQPWMLVFASNFPHANTWGRVVPQQLRVHFDADQLTVPEYLVDTPETRDKLVSYYAALLALDNQVGELMKMLEETRQVEKTLVIFHSEQGCSLPYGGKWSLYDNGIRNTALARWPGRIPAGSTTDALLQDVDLAPTLLQAAGVDPTTIDTGRPDAGGNTGFDGSSFLDVLLGKTDHHRDYVFAQHTTVGVIGFREPYPIRSVRDCRYKLIHNIAHDNTFWIRGIHVASPIDSWRQAAEQDAEIAARIRWLSHRPEFELYDLRHDPLETNNLADQSDHTQIKRRLKTQLDAWMLQQGDDGLETELQAPSRRRGG